jgi:rfaE bifunctional protein kinase chain/domain
MDNRALRKIIGRFSGRRIMVLGDFVMDEYLFGTTSRISREAPVLILKYASRERVPGGAGNAARNLAALGAKVLPVGVVGDDEMGRELLRMLKRQNMDTTLLLLDRGRITSTKTRILAGGPHTSKQQVVRLDREEPSPIPPEHETMILQVLEEELEGVDALLISDYNGGTLTPRVVDRINRLSQAGRKVVTVDSRYQMLKYRGVTAVTPNEPEVEEALGVKLNDNEQVLRSCGQKILDQVKPEAVLVTRGSKGMALFERNGKSHFLPIYGSDEIADVTGAGDTVISSFTLALTAGATMIQAAQLANVGGGIVVMKRGTATINPEELEAALSRKP